MYLPLAEKMIEKMVKDERIEAEAEVTIYLMVLDYLGKHEKALGVIEGSLGSRFTSRCRRIRHGSQIWLQLSAASPTNRPQPKVIITIVIIKLKLWPAAGCEAKVAAELSSRPWGKGLEEVFRIEAEAEVTIYLMVLDYLGKHEKALEVIEGSLGSRFTSRCIGKVGVEE